MPNTAYFPSLRSLSRRPELNNDNQDDKTSPHCVASAALIECGDALPPPLDQQKRTIHVNLRLTGYEKRIIEAVARRKGYDGVSEFLRVTALKACSS